MFKFFFVIILPMLFINCTNKQKDKSNTYFGYYDLNSLEGKMPLDGKNLDYPYVSIKDTNGAKIITHFFSENDSFQSKYSIVGENKFERFIPNSINNPLKNIKEYIQNDSIIVVAKNITTDNHIFNIGIYSGNTISLIGFQDVTKEDFTASSAIRYINNIKKGVKSTLVFTKTDDTVSISYESKYIENFKPFYSKIHYLKGNNKPFHHWLIFSWKYYVNSIFDSPENLMALGAKKDSI